jgi:Spy/CpxP family protein refolding chaperone
MNKITAIVGAATLVVGLMALPALAGTTQPQVSGWVGQMQGFMQQTFSPSQHQTIINSTAMQNLRNSAGMQKAMQTGDVKAIQDLMNSDPNVKAQIGQGNLDKMNQFMSNSGGNMMTNRGGNSNSGSLMMNGSGLGL